jgi:hypothetical protein
MVNMHTCCLDIGWSEKIAAQLKALPQAERGPHLREAFSAWDNAVRSTSLREEYMHSAQKANINRERGKPPAFETQAVTHIVQSVGRQFEAMGGLSIL